MGPLADPLQPLDLVQQNVPVCQTSGYESLGFSQTRQRFNSKAFAITLTELSAMAAPATTGLR